MRLPDFLVIGAMKSGSTSLYYDLSSNPSIYLATKEANCLVQSIEPADYARRFRAARAHQVCGDVSMQYSMLPDYPGVVERSRKLLPQGTKLVYLIREPVSRAVSHHYHRYSMHGPMHMDGDFDACVRRYPCLTDYGCYARQLEPWLRCWGEDAIRVIRFEDYVANRRGTVTALCKFLGADPHPDLVQADVVRNASVGKPVTTPFWASLLQSPLYRRVVRPCMSTAVRDYVRTKVLPAAPSRPAPPHPDTVAELVSAFAPDERRLRDLTGRAEPHWDFGAVQSTYTQRYQRGWSDHAARCA